MPDYLINNKPYEKKSGVACFAPYVSVIISALSGQSQEKALFDARIDTGADITCIPKIHANKLGPLIIGNPITVRGHDGTISRVWTYRMNIAIMCYPDGDRLKTYRPERGVLLTDSNIGLIGMDIIGACSKVIFDSISQEFFIEC